MRWDLGFPNPWLVFFQKSPLNLRSGSEFPVDKFSFFKNIPHWSHFIEEAASQRSSFSSYLLPAISTHNLFLHTGRPWRTQLESFQGNLGRLEQYFPSFLASSEETCIPVLSSMPGKGLQHCAAPSTIPRPRMNLADSLMGSCHCSLWPQEEMSHGYEQRTRSWLARIKELGSFWVISLALELQKNGSLSEQGSVATASEWGLFSTKGFLYPFGT